MKDILKEVGIWGQRHYTSPSNIKHLNRLSTGGLDYSYIIDEIMLVTPLFQRGY